MKNLLLACLLLSMCGVASAQIDLQQSHIAANVPARDAFDHMLKRDLLAFRRKSSDAPVSNVTYQLLRDVPTQSGTAYPKFYAWVRFSAGDSLLSEGAVRVAAIEQSRFEVTHFAQIDAIRRDPEALKSVFPAALVPLIVQKARVR